MSLLARWRVLPWLLCCLPACTLLRPLDELSSAQPEPVSQPQPGSESEAPPLLEPEPLPEPERVDGSDDTAARAADPAAPGDTPPSSAADSIALGDDPSIGASEAGADFALPNLATPAGTDAGTPGAPCKSDAECLESRCLEGGGGCQPCPPEMSLTRFDDGTAFCIDRFEVTERQYAEFLASVVERPDVAARPVCAENASLQPSEDGTCAGQFQPDTGGDLPVACVDACDALAYCLWAGKRLCGARHGLVLPPALAGDARIDEWQASCTGGTSRLYPYGGSFLVGVCNVGAAGVAAVGAHEACATDGGVFDLSGNVSEWTDCCRSIDGELRCAARGGSFAHESPLGVACNPAPSDGADPLLAPPYLSHAPHIGIRCCAD